MSVFLREWVKAAWGLAGVCLFLSGASGAFGHYAASHRGAPSAWRETVNRAAPEFTLTDQQGRPFSLPEKKGEAVLLAFVFTSCPDLCPLVTAQMAAVAGRLGAGAPLHLVTVTTDPEVDRPDVLRAYARRFGADPERWSFLTGSRRMVEAVWRAYGVSVTPIARGLVEHNYVLALIDANGVWRATYHGEGWDVSQVAADLHRILPGPVAMQR